MNFIDILDASSDVQSRVRNIRNDVNVRRFMYSAHEISESEHSKWLDSLRHNPNQKVYVVMDHIEVYGVVSLSEINRVHRTADWAFYLDPAMQGKGVGSVIEFRLLDLAFGDVGLEKLNCEVLEFNESVVRLHKKFGFSIEGVRRKNIIKDEDRVDVVLMGITKEEWSAQRSKMSKLIGRVSRA